MRVHLWMGLSVISLIAFGSDSSLAQIGAAQCVDRGLDGAYAPWGQIAVEADTATGENNVPAHAIPIGTRIHLTLAHRDDVAFVLPPEEPNMPVEYVYSGMAHFTLPEAGTYRIASVEGMWIDVVQNGVLVTSTAFGRGPECMGKHVDFPLTAGEAVLQLSGGPYETVDVLIVKVP